MHARHTGCLRHWTTDPADIDHALQVATAADTVVIDPAWQQPQDSQPPCSADQNAVCCIMLGMHRRASSSDGWLLNPRSDRPDQAMGKQLATFMAEYEGHGKAIQENWRRTASKREPWTKAAIKSKRPLSRHWVLNWQPCTCLNPARILRRNEPTTGSPPMPAL